MFYYRCIKCNHIVKQKVEMKRHLKRKFKCLNINVVDCDDITLFNQSLIKQKLNEGETFETLKLQLENNIMIKSNQLNKFHCSNCNACFQNEENYNIHIENNSCYVKQNSSNTTHITNILNQQNIININFPMLKPFDEDWDVSNIDYALKNILLISSLKYTKTLEHILKNEKNLNVFIESLDSQTGIVYANDNERFKEMSIKDIVDISMEKISKHLHDFHKQILDKNDFQMSSEYLEEEKHSILNKLEEYKNNENVKEKVQEFLTKIFNSKKKDSMKIFKELIDEDKKSLLDGY